MIKNKYNNTKTRKTIKTRKTTKSRRITKSRRTTKSKRTIKLKKNNNNNNNITFRNTTTRNTTTRNKSLKFNKTKKTLKTLKTLNTNEDDDYLGSLTDFKKSKSLTYSSKSSDFKSFTINDIITEEPIHNKMISICTNKLQKYKSNLSKNTCNNLCNCLLDKNKNLTVYELERLTKKHEETPGSKCVLLLKN